MQPQQVFLIYGCNITDRQYLDKIDCQLIPHSHSY